MNPAFPKRLAAVLLVPLLALSLAAAATVVPLDGATPQRAVALVPFANSIAVRVMDAQGTPVAGADVTLNAGSQIAPVANSGCELDFMITWRCTTRSDAQGIARFPQLHGQYAGNYSADVRATLGTTELGSTTLTFVVDPVRAPALIDVVAGTGQSAVIGTPLAQPFVVRLQRASGSAISGAKLFISPTTLGPGGFSPALDQLNGVFTDGAGRAVLPPIVAGWGTGEVTATVTYLDDDARVIVVTPLKYSVVNAQGGLNLAFQGMWWSGPLENGWGMSVVQHQDRLFNVLFVYDAAGQPTWYVQPEGHWIDGLLGGQFVGPMYSPHGSPWFAYDASRFVVGNPVGLGSSTLTFQGETRGRLDFGSALTQGVYLNVRKQIVPQDFGGPVPAPIQGLSDMWWGGLQQNGWGVSIHERNGALFMVWFTYDESGLPTWFVMPGGEWRGSDTYAGTIYRTRSSAWATRSTSYDASRLNVEPFGSFSLRFASRERATLSYEMMGRSGQLSLERQGF